MVRSHTDIVTLVQVAGTEVAPEPSSADGDVAELFVSLSLIAGDRALDSAMEAMGTNKVGAAVRYLQSQRSQLDDVGSDVIVEEPSNANWTWVVVAIGLASNVGETIALQAADGRDTPFGPTLLLRFAIGFISLGVRAVAGHIGMGGRYLQRMASLHR